MPSFDFISDSDFRKSLESDFVEMNKSVEAGAWKSAQVLAGSVVEALLIDYLASVPNAARITKNPISMDLSEAISICRAEKILSDRTADLCSVIRSFRNLIHPGRLIRLNEPAPSNETARIALSLIEIITEEVAQKRRSQVGLTAEQLLSKVERDHDVLSIYKHLVLEANEQQRQRLLLELFPKAHAAYRSHEAGLELTNRIEAAYSITLGAVPNSIKERVAHEFVRILREEDGQYISQYADAFFRAPALAFVPEAQRAMVRGYLLDRMKGNLNLRTLAMVDDISGHLAIDEATKWVDPLLMAAIGSNTNPKVKVEAKGQLRWSTVNTSVAFDRVVADRLSVWKTHYKSTGVPDKAELVNEIANDMVPF